MVALESTDEALAISCLSCPEARGCARGRPALVDPRAHRGRRVNGSRGDEGEHSDAHDADTLAEVGQNGLLAPTRSADDSSGMGPSEVNDGIGEPEASAEVPEQIHRVPLNRRASDL